MDDRNEIIQQTVSKLQTINSLEEFKAREQEVIECMETYIKSAIDSLEDFVENMFSMSEEEREQKAKVFQEENFPFEPQVEKEMQRFDSLPGFIEYAEIFGPKMDKMMQPYMIRYSEHMEKVMENLVGGVVDGVVEGMTQAFGSFESEEDVEDTWEFDYDNPETPDMLYDLYSSRTLESLKENKETLIESIEDQLAYDISDLEILSDMQRDGFELQERDRDKIGQISKRVERFEPEVEKEMNRISALPGAADEAAGIYKEIKERLGPRIAEASKYLDKIK